MHAHVEHCADCKAERAAPPLAVTSLPGTELSRAAAVSAVAAPVLAWIRFVVARLAASLISLRSSVLRAFQATARAARGAAGTGATRLLAARARLTRGAAALPVLLMPSARAAADLLGRARGVSARAPRLLIWLGSASRSASRGSVHAVGVAAGTGTTRLLGSLGWLGAQLAISSARFVGATRRAMAAGRTGATRFLGVLIRAGARVPVFVAPSARAVGRAVVMIPARAWAHPRVCAGVAGFVMLVASLVLLGPPPDNRVPLRDVRLPVDRRPAEPAVVMPLVQTVPPTPAAAPQPVPAPRVSAPVAHAAVPVPVRRAAVPAPQPPGEATQNVEASDPAAAIDWLLKTSGRRNTERP